MKALSAVGKTQAKPRGEKSIYKNSKRNKAGLSSGIGKKKSGAKKPVFGDIPVVKKKKGGKFADL